MLSLSKIEDKKGLSNLVAYVLLITITLSLSVMVYSWLKFYVSTEDAKECPSNVNIVIDSYSCVSGGDNFTVSLKNKGLFSIDGFILRAHNRSDADFGFYRLNDTGVFLAPGESVEYTYNFSGVTFIDVQPFIMEEDRVACKSYASQRINCNSVYSPPSNHLPNTPFVYINSTDGSNVTTQDLNCFATVSDPDGDSLTAEVRWYRDGIIFGSYLVPVVNGNVWDGLNSFHTSTSEVWSCGFVISDYEFSLPESLSSSLTIL